MRRREARPLALFSVIPGGDPTCRDREEGDGGASVTVQERITALVRAIARTWPINHLARKKVTQKGRKTAHPHDHLSGEIVVLHPV